MKYSESEFKEKVAELYGSELKIVSKYISIHKPIYVEDKYGVLKVSKAGYILNYKPGIKLAVNKTLYAMNMVKNKYPNIYNSIEIIGEYISMKTLTLFKTKFGIVKTTFDALLSGHMPNIRSAIDRKSYFKNQLMFLYDGLYDFKVENTSRHGGKSILICPIHGEVVIDNDYIFSGRGCPKCNNITPSDAFYFIRLKKDNFECNKIGISYRSKGTIRRYNDYKKMGYDIEVIKEIDFKDFLELKSFESKIKKIIKDFTITPPIWPNNSSTECFTNDLSTVVLNNIHMIWSDLHGDM